MGVLGRRSPRRDRHGAIQPAGSLGRVPVLLGVGSGERRRRPPRLASFLHPREPGTDYPIMATTQDSGFSCDGLVFGGYYADPATECQQYSVCLQDPISPDTLYPVNFLCPNGTIFNQELFNCDWWFNVDCLASEGLYGGAEGAFGTAGGSGVGDDVGSCPAVSPGSPEECAGAVSTCWSPGQRDTDCPGNGLCCFDGCADTCDGQPAVQSAAQADPVRQTTEGYNYEVPEVTLAVRPEPVTTPRPTTPAALYGAPPRRGRRGRRISQRRKRKQGRRVKNARSSRQIVFV